MKRQDVLKRPIAIMGGGACAQAFAAEFAMEGFKVRLCELPAFAAKALGGVLKSGEIEFGGAQRNFKWFRREGVGKLSMVTTDAAKALKGAGLVIVALPAKGHKPFFEAMIPHLEDGQVISVFPDNFGTLELRKMMRDAGCDADVIVGGWTSMPYGVRMLEPGKLDCCIRIRELMGDALPSKDGEAFLSIMKGIPPFDGIMEVKRCDTVLSAGLSNPNPLVHVPGSLLNVGAMEVSEMEGIFGIPKGKYSMYKHGMCPAVSRAQFAFYREERAIAKAMGVKMIEYREDQFFWKGTVMGFEYWVPFVDVVMPPIVGPDTVEHRYFTEDIPVGTVARYHLAQKFGVAAPMIESMIRLGSVVCGRDFLKEGITLKDMGLDMPADEMVQYVRTSSSGKKKPTNKKAPRKK